MDSYGVCGVLSSRCPMPDATRFVLRVQSTGINLIYFYYYIFQEWPPISPSSGLNQNVSMMAAKMFARALRQPVATCRYTAGSLKNTQASVGARFYSSGEEREYIIVSKQGKNDSVGMIQLHRPKGPATPHHTAPALSHS